MQNTKSTSTTTYCTRQRPLGIGGKMSPLEWPNTSNSATMHTSLVGRAAAHRKHIRLLLLSLTKSHLIAPVGAESTPRTRRRLASSTAALLLLAAALVAAATHNTCYAIQQAEPSIGSDAVAYVETNRAREPSAEGHRVTVIAPKYLRPQSDYRVLVSLANSSTPASVDIQLIGARDSNREQSDAKSVLVESDETQTIKFQVGEWPRAEYILSVTAQAVDRSWNFTQEHEIGFKAKTYSGFVQTDKAIYRPGELVQFRAIFLSQTLRPFEIKDDAINVTVSDPQHNIVKQWLGLSNWRGLLTLEFQLSDDPMLGEWTIVVSALGQEFAKEFRVAEYILPTFEVQLELPPYATYKDSSKEIVATVRAHYTYGKPVSGHVTLTVQPLVRFTQIDTRPLRQSQHRARLENGKAEIGVDIVKELARERRDIFERNVEFFALVEEDLTGRKYNKTQVLKVYDTDVKVELIGPPETVRVFRPGLEHTVQLRVAYQDDTPVEDNGRDELELLVDVFGNRRLESARLRPLGGIVQHTIKVPRKIAVSADGEHSWTPDQINLEANYRGHKHYLRPLVAFTSASEQYMKITLPQVLARQRLSSSSAAAAADKRRRLAEISGGVFVQVGDELRVRVSSTERMQQVTCNGYARGQIVWALSRDASNSTEFEFDVHVEQRMAPESRILCYYVRDENKELIADAVTVLVGGSTRNFVKVSTSAQEVRPGERVDVDVLTRPDSLVGVLALDQSVALLRTGNDISPSDVARDLKQYGGGGGGGRGADAPEQGSQVLDPHRQELASNAQELFDKTDMVVLSNALVYDGPPRRTGKLVLAGGVAGSVLGAREPPTSIKLDRLLLDSELKPQAIKLGKQRLDTSEPLVIRSQFPETWLWANASVGSDGRAHFSGRVPDSITSWQVSAFSLNENHGLGLMAAPASLRVFKHFFVRLNLPAAIIRGETVGVQVLVFNYGARAQQVKVTLENRDNEFEFVEAANRVEDERRSGGRAESRSLRVGANEAQSVTFLVAPRRVGHLDVRVVAQGELAGDGLVRKLLVKPEGQAQRLNRALLVELDAAASRFRRNISIEVPANAVPNSTKVTVSASGDLLGAALGHVDDLVRLPHGSGEQNMIKLVPNIVLLNYLSSTGRLRESQRDRAKHNIELGYQRQLNYRRPDGSFGEFGDEQDQTLNGSVRLTAYVLKALQQAKQIVPEVDTIDEQVIARAASFVARHSRADGSIAEEPATERRTRSLSDADSVYLSAYALIALMQRPVEQAPGERPIGDVVDKGLDFLERNIDAADSNRKLAIIAHALTLANSRQRAADTAYERLWARARHERDLTWWTPMEHSTADGAASGSAPATGKLPAEAVSFETETESESADEQTQARSQRRLPPLKPLPVNAKQSEHLFVPDSLAVETTSYALMSTVSRGDLSRAEPIVRWLVGQQNSNGGFASTQDTVLALEALAAFARATSAAKSSSAAASTAARSSTPAIDIDLVYPRAGQQQLGRSSLRRTDSDQILITPSNALLNQQLRLPDNITWLQLEATGRGVAVVQVAWQYNILVSAERPAFYLNPIIDKSSNANYLQLSVCTYYKHESADASNMAVVEVELPSGYVADMDALPGLRRTASIKRVDATDGETKVIIYLNRVTRDELCFTVPAHRSTRVSNNKPVPVSIYDYYDRSKTARIFYEPPATSSCDICDRSSDDSCARECNKRLQKSAKLVSLHEQRHLNARQHFNGSGSDAQSRANLNRADDTDNNTGNKSTTVRIIDATSLLPLAPVLQTIVSAGRHLSQLNATAHPVAG